ncbi:MAG: oligosaccharide flippase family protein [Patescibacteria group bacterium]
MQRLKSRGLLGLKWLGAYFETDAVYIAKSSFWLTLGQVSSAIIALLSSVFFANYVDKDIYGQYKFVLSLTGILGALSLTGMGSVVVQAVAKGAEGILKDSVRVSLRWGVFILFFGLCGSGYYFFNDNNVLGTSLLIASIAMPLMNAFGLYGGLFSGRKNFKLSTLYWLATQSLTTIGLVVSAIYTQSVVSLIFIYFAVSTLCALYGYYRVITKYKPNEVRDGTMIPYGKHMSLMNLFGTLANQLDKVLVFHYLGAVNLAIYSFSQAIPEQIKGSFKNLFAIALPKYAVLSDHDLRKSILKKTGQLTGITLIIVLGYIVCAPLVFKILFPKYTEAVIYSQIYALGLLAIPGISLFATYFQLKKATRTMYKLTVISNTVTIALTLVLVYKFGLKGAVIENGLSWLTMLAVNYYFFATHKETISS